MICVHGPVSYLGKLSLDFARFQLLQRLASVIGRRKVDEPVSLAVARALVDDRFHRRNIAEPERRTQSKTHNIINKR